MKTLIKAQWRLALKQPFYLVGIGFLIMVIAFSFSLITALTHRLDAGYDDYLETYNVEDFHITLGAIDYKALTGNQQLSLCIELDLLKECSLTSTDESINALNIKINARIKDNPELYLSLYDTVINRWATEYSIAFEKNVTRTFTQDMHVFRFISLNQTINLPVLSEGRMPSAPGEVLIFKSYARAQGFSLGDTLTIGNTTYSVVGFGYASDHAFPVMHIDTIVYDKNNHTIVIAPYQTVIEAPGDLTLKYQAKGEFDDLFEVFDVGSILSSDLSVYGRNLQMVRLVVPRALNVRIMSLSLEAEYARSFAQLFLGVFTVFSGVIMLAFMKRFIDEARRDLMFLKALGYKTRTLTLSLMVIPLLFAALYAIGFILGEVSSGFLSSLYTARYQKPFDAYRAAPLYLLYALALPVILFLSLSYLYSAQLIQRLYKKTRYHVWTRVKQLLKNTSMQFITFTMLSVMLLFGLSSYTMIRDFKTSTSAGNNYTAMVFYRSVQTEPYSASYDAFHTQSSTLTLDTMTVKTVVYGIDPQATLKDLTPHQDTLSNTALNDGVIITHYLAMKHSIAVGDSLTFTLGEVEETHTVVAISNERIESAFYIDIALLNAAFNQPSEAYNGLYVTDDNYPQENILRTFSYHSAMRDVETVLRLSNILVVSLLSVALIMSVFLLYLFMLYLLLEQFNVFTTLKAMGYYPFERFIRFAKRPFLTSIFGLSFAFFITIELARKIEQTLLNSIGFAFTINVGVTAFVITLILMQVINILVIYGALSRFEKIPLSEAIKKL